jgi:hypothetical protein
MVGFGAAPWYLSYVHGSTSTPSLSLLVVSTETYPKTSAQTLM